MMRKVFWALFCLLVLAIVAVVVLCFYNVWFVESKDAVSAAPLTTKFIDISNEKVAYSEINNNSSTTVIFVGGLSAWNGTWKRVIEKLNSEKSDLNYVAIDLPPFGYSLPSAEKKYFRDTQAERIASFIENKTFDNVILVGHSYGAGPSVEYVMRNQQKVRKLILVDAVLNIDETKIISKYSPVQLTLLRNVLIGTLIHVDSFGLSQLKKFVYITDHIDQELLSVYTRYFDTKNTTQRFSLWLRDYVNDPLDYLSNSSGNYKKISVPVRLIWGDKDTITPIEGTKILLDTVPDIQLITLEGVGHIPMIEQYELFDTELLNALNN